MSLKSHLMLVEVYDKYKNKFLQEKVGLIKFNIDMWRAICMYNNEKETSESIDNETGLQRDPDSRDK